MCKKYYFSTECNAWPLTGELQHALTTRYLAICCIPRGMNTQETLWPSSEGGSLGRLRSLRITTSSRTKLLKVEKPSRVMQSGLAVMPQMMTSRTFPQHQVSTVGGYGFWIIRALTASRYILYVHQPRCRPCVRGYLRTFGAFHAAFLGGSSRGKLDA